MKKIFFGILITAIIGLLSGCIVTDNHDEYETKQYHSTNEISEIMITDISTNITIQSSDSNDVRTTAVQGLSALYYNNTFCQKRPQRAAFFD